MVKQLNNDSSPSSECVTLVLMRRRNSWGEKRGKISDGKAGPREGQTEGKHTLPGGGVMLALGHQAL